MVCLSLAKSSGILQEKLALHAALAILRLTDKYRMEALHRGVTRILFENWPLNYEEYVSRQKYLGFIRMESPCLNEADRECPTV